MSCSWLPAMHTPLACSTDLSFPCSVKEVESIFFNLPNLHFLPCKPVTSKVSLTNVHKILEHLMEHSLLIRISTACSSRMTCTLPPASPMETLKPQSRGTTFSHIASCNVTLIGQRASWKPSLPLHLLTCCLFMNFPGFLPTAPCTLINVSLSQWLNHLVLEEDLVHGLHD